VALAAVACGAANTLSPGAGVFDSGDVEALRRQVQIWRLDEVANTAD